MLHHEKHIDVKGLSDLASAVRHKSAVEEAALTEEANHQYRQRYDAAKENIGPELRKIGAELREAAEHGRRSIKCREVTPASCMAHYTGGKPWLPEDQALLDALTEEGLFCRVEQEEERDICDSRYTANKLYVSLSRWDRLLR